MFFGRALSFVVLISGVALALQGSWTRSELALLESLSLERLPAFPNDPSNQYQKNDAAILLGQKFFYDPRFSGKEDISCATCHMPSSHYVDNLALSEGRGVGTRKALSVVGAAYSQWLFWDGRADSLWAQALGPLENPIEHAGTRAQYANVVRRLYKKDYEAVFGKLPPESVWAKLPARAGPTGTAAEQQAWRKLSYSEKDTINRVFVNIGKAIAAFETQLKPGWTRFDSYIANLRKTNAPTTLTPDEIAGAKLFIGKAGCVSCHAGARMTDDKFYNTGVPTPKALEIDEGRQRAVRAVIQAEFGCWSPYSDSSSNCGLISGNTNAAQAPAGAFKTPSLRNVGNHYPYMHSGQFFTLEEVVRHYNEAPKSDVGVSRLKPLNLSDFEQKQLVAFLHTLSAPVNAPANLLETPELPQ
ncbi:MAG: cytochrome-c peroxidase [Deinococcales bacterium]